MPGPGAEVGPVSPAVVERYGLAGDCRVVAGTTDSIAAFIASRASKPGQVCGGGGQTVTQIAYHVHRWPSLGDSTCRSVTGFSNVSLKSNQLLGSKSRNWGRGFRRLLTPPKQINQVAHCGGQEPRHTESVQKSAWTEERGRVGAPWSPPAPPPPPRQ